VIGFTGAFDLLQLGSLANGAHLGGLIGGAALGVLAVALMRLRTRLEQS
jgi:membrane associated rhomboid family serine protease